MTLQDDKKFIVTFSEYKWNIFDFLSFSEKNGECISSPIFSSIVVPGSTPPKWRLVLYPVGDTEENKDYVSIFLKSLTDISVVVDCEISISSIMKVYYRNTFRHLFTKRGIKGFTNCIKSQILLNELILEKSDRLTVLLKISFSSNLFKTSFQLNLANDIASLLNGDHHDIILKSSDGIEFKAHKLILMCRSKNFLKAFQYTMNDTRVTTIKLEDVDSFTLGAILQFIYTGNVECMLSKTLKLLEAANKYELNDLRAMCIFRISENLTNNNILDMIKFAHGNNINQLKVETRKYFLKNRKIIMSTDGPQKLKELPRDILESLLCDVSIYDE